MGAAWAWRTMRAPVAVQASAPRCLSDHAERATDVANDGSASRRPGVPDPDNARRTEPSLHPTRGWTTWPLAGELHTLGDQGCAGNV